MTNPLTNTVVKWALGILVAVILFVALWSWWDNLWDWMPWSTESQLTNAQNELDITKADQALTDAQAGEQGAIYGRDREYVMQQPIIIRQVESAANRAESAGDNRAASDAFLDGVCARTVAAGDPRCVAQNNTGVSEGEMR